MMFLVSVRGARQAHRIGRVWRALWRRAASHDSVECAGGQGSLSLKGDDVRRVVASVCALAFLTMTGVRAEDKWPSQQVNIIVPFSAGGSTDILARVVAQHLQAKFGQPFIVQNKSGAGGGIGSAAVAKAQPAGYTRPIGHGGPAGPRPVTATHRHT